MEQPQPQESLYRARHRVAQASSKAAAPSQSKHSRSFCSSASRASQPYLQFPSDQPTPQHQPRTAAAGTMSAAMNGSNLVTSIPSVPVTEARPVPIGLDKELPQPGIPRANKAVSKEVPNGSPSHLAREDYTVMQQHVAFFDRDNDGVLWPWDTYIGFRRLGFGRIISTLAVPFIHGSFSYPSSPSILPDPFMRIYMKNMHRCKHGSDSEVYDTEGRFVPEKFEELFSKFDRTNKGGLSWDDLQAMILANMNIVDPVGWIAERLEWWVFYLLAADDNGIIAKEKVRGQYDGSLWYKIADEVEAKTAARKQALKAKWQ